MIPIDQANRNIEILVNAFYGHPDPDSDVAQIKIALDELKDVIVSLHKADDGRMDATARRILGNPFLFVLLGKLEIKLDHHRCKSLDNSILGLHRYLHNLWTTCNDVTFPKDFIDELDNLFDEKGLVGELYSYIRVDKVASYLLSIEFANVLKGIDQVQNF